MDTPLRHFLEIPYEQLEEMNLQAKADRVAGKDPGKIREARMKYLTDEKRIKAVTVLFTDLEGRFHLLDYDKKFLLVELRQPHLRRLVHSRLHRARRRVDLRLGIDWSAFYWVPADVFGTGKVLVFGRSSTRTAPPTPGTCAADLRAYLRQLWEKDYTLTRPTRSKVSSSPGQTPSKSYHETGQFEYPTPAATTTPFPLDPLRKFIDTCGRSAARDRAFATRRTTRRSRPASSRSTTATAKSRSPPTRFSSTS